MNNLSDDRVKFYASANPPFGYTGSEINFMARELLALREAQSKAVAVVELSDYISVAEALGEVPRRKAVKELYDGALVVGQQLYAAPQLPVPNSLVSAVNRLLDSDGSRGTYSAIRCGDAREEIERLLTVPQLPDKVQWSTDGDWSQAQCLGWNMAVDAMSAAAPKPE